MVVIDAPHLRIVEDHIWAAVQARISTHTQREKGGRPATYILSGVLRCEACGGPMTVLNGRDSAEAVKVYACARRRDRGGTACGARGRMRVAAVDAAVMDWIQTNILTEQVLRELVAEVRRRVAARRTDHEDEATRLEGEIAKLRGEVNRIAEVAIEAPAGARDVFYNKLADRKAALDAAAARLRVVRTAPAAIDLELRRLERDALSRVASLRELVGRSDPTPVRAMVRALFPSGLKATTLPGPTGATMRLRGEAAPGLLLELEADGNVASPAGHVSYCTQQFSAKKRSPALPIHIQTTV